MVKFISKILKNKEVQGLAFFLFLLKISCKSNLYLYWWLLILLPLELKIPQFVILSEDSDIVSQLPFVRHLYLNFFCSIWHYHLPLQIILPFDLFIPALLLLTYNSSHLGYTNSLAWHAEPLWQVLITILCFLHFIHVLATLSSLWFVESACYYHLWVLAHKFSPFFLWLVSTHFLSPYWNGKPPEGFFNLLRRYVFFLHQTFI